MSTGSNFLEDQFLATFQSNYDHIQVARFLVNVCDYLQPCICPGVVRLDLVRLSEKWWNRNRCPKERFSTRTRIAFISLETWY